MAIGIENLRPYTSDTEGKARAREGGRKGGIRSGEVKRERKLIKDRILERMGEGDWDTMIDNLIRRAAETDKAFEVLRDTIGEKPVERVETDGKVEVVLSGEAQDLAQ